MTGTTSPHDRLAFALGRVLANGSRPPCGDGSGAWVSDNRDERAMAADDRDCQAEYFRPVYLEVRSAAEQRFVDRNGDLLDELAKLSGLG